MLVDFQIRQLCQGKAKPLLDPFSEGVQGNGVISYGLTHAGYDLRLGLEILQYNKNCDVVVDPKQFGDPEYQKVVFNRHECKPGEPFILRPHDYVLARSLEYIRMPKDLKATCVGKSTYARSLILVNTTPLEPGWEGHLTIEIGNLSPLRACLYPGEGIAQLEFHRLEALPTCDYGQKGGKYQGQTGVTPAIVK